MQQFTIGYVSDCLTVTVHAGKFFKALVDSGTTISLMNTGVYNMIEDHYKTSILPTEMNFWTTDGSPMSLMGKGTLHLWIVDFKFSHTFIICDRLVEADFLFVINLQNWYSLSYCWDSARHLFIQREGSFLTHTRNKEDLHNIALVKCSLKIPPGHNGTIPIRIRGHDLHDQVAYFVSNQYTKKELNPNIHILNDIHNIKEKSMVYIMVVNYTNKHITFNKGQCIGHMEPLIDRSFQTSVNSFTTQQKMMYNQIQLDTFTPPLFHITSTVK